MPTVSTRLRIAAWDENPVAEFEDDVLRSATGDLVGLTCSLTSTPTPADRPFMPLILDYELT